MGLHNTQKKLKDQMSVYLLTMLSDSVVSILDLSKNVLNLFAIFFHSETFLFFLSPNLLVHLVFYF